MTIKIMTPEERKEKRRAYDKVYKKANKEKCRTQNKIYCETNKEKLRAYRKARYKAHPKKAMTPEKIRKSHNDSNKAWRKANPEKQRAASKAWGEVNKDKLRAYSKAWREANPKWRHTKEARKKHNEGTKAWRNANPEKQSALCKAWNRANKEKCNARSKAWREANPKYMSIYISKRYHNDINFRILCVLRGRLHSALKGKTKSARTMVLIGCSTEEVRIHLERQFKLGMTWDNWGNGEGCWNIDHIRPCSSYDLTDPEQQKLCFHWTNLQPLWAKDNLIKSDKWEVA
jgi:hypothetical protein